MSQVNDILNIIGRLSAAEWKEPLERLTDRLEEAWRREAQAARAAGKDRCVDQIAIDRAVAEHRYGE